MVSSEVTRITPSVSWLASALVQLAGRALPCRTEETVAPMACAEHQSSTPRRISTAHGLSSPLKIRSIKPGPPLAPLARALVAALPEQPLDQSSRVRRDVRASVDDFGHRRQRDARFGGNRRQSRPASSASVRRAPVPSRLSARHVPTTLLMRPGASALTRRLPCASCAWPLRWDQTFETIRQNYRRSIQHLAQRPADRSYPALIWLLPAIAPVSKPPRSSQRDGEWSL